MVLHKEPARNPNIQITGTKNVSLIADERAVKQILLNLLSNAVKFCSDGGRIEVRIAQTTQNLCMEVRDDGAGISAEDLKRLGQPFEQVTQDSRLARGGTGLGLALVHGLAARHGGEVKIDSVLGEGTTVRVTLPRHAEVAETLRCLA